MHVEREAAFKELFLVISPNGPKCSKMLFHVQSFQTILIHGKQENNFTFLETWFIKQIGHMRASGRGIQRKPAQVIFVRWLRANYN